MSKIIDLSGSWEFTCRPESRTPGETYPENFPGSMIIPGFWDDHYELFDYTDDFDRNARFNPEYRPIHFPMGQVTPDASKPFITGTAYYRKKITIANIDDCCAVLSVGPAVWGSEVFCNGRSAGYNSGYSTGYEYDLTGLLKAGENEIIIVVSNCNRGGARDSANGQHRGCAVRGFKSTRGGISRGVSLKLSSKAVITGCCAALKDGNFYFTADISGKGEFTLRYTVSYQGKTLLGNTLALSGNSTVCDSADAENLPRWSDCSPELCRLNVELLSGNDILDTRDTECGFAEMQVDGFDILLNGVPKFLRGSTEHCYYPETCNPHCDAEKYFRDLSVLKAAGFNFMRCHTWCPPEEFFTACDRLGMIVQTEVPPNSSVEEWQSIIRMISRHVSARILCGGNEENLTANHIGKLRKLQQNMKLIAPWMLFNPQEALPLVEYRLEATPQEELHDGDIIDTPYPHNKRKLAEIAEFSDLYGGFNWGFASYFPDEFPGVEEMEKRLAVYNKPCLSHEAGILGGYIDLALESRYKDTYITSELYTKIREYQQKNGVSFKKSQYFYELNSRYIASLRKQLLENLRSCPTLRGYDFLGGVDCHWHRCGYPCGVFNEFYEAKPGETAETFRRCNGESVLLCDAGFQRNYRAGTAFEQEISISYFGETVRKNAVVTWNFNAGDFTVSGTIPAAELIPGKVLPLGKVKFELPAFASAVKAVLSCTLLHEGFKVVNDWNFWCYPEVSSEIPENSAVAYNFTEKEIDFVANGGNLLLLDDFPCDVSEEFYRPCSTGRSNGHYGFYVNSHPVMDEFPHENFLEFQIFNMMSSGKALLFKADSPLPFAPAVGLIPPYKLHQQKALIAEYAVGKGRLVLCTLNLDIDDPAAKFLKAQLLNYLSCGNFVPAPAAAPETLKKLCGKSTLSAAVTTDIAWDPNAGK